MRAADQVIALTQTDVKLHVWKNKGTFRPDVEALVRREMTDGRIDQVLELASRPNSDFVVQGLPAEATPSPAALVPHCSPISVRSRWNTVSAGRPHRLVRASTSGSGSSRRAVVAKLRQALGDQPVEYLGLRRLRQVMVEP